MKLVVKGKLWRWPSGNWHFVYLEKDLSEKIREKFGKGFIPVMAKVGKSEWRTALFPVKGGPYMLSIKASVRRTEALYDGDLVRVVCQTL